ncbi:Acyl-coenzyme A thioesterase 13 [Senna tora]|uniref:Acyl-coenzyme A thioesterase 13 n=1 Tax=Senna tora TaxID=362788 RepID=A0A834W9K2_9FABA|nr:Acyl-coenzyme A thioesterase 13 [Senna tora]
MADSSPLQLSLNMLRDLSNGTYGQEIAVLSSKGIRVVNARRAIATLIDNVGSLATYSLVPAFNVSVDFSISFFSTAKLQEEVEIEAKVVGKKERLSCVVVQVRNKLNAQLIALGKQWMAATFININNQPSKL